MGYSEEELREIVRSDSMGQAVFDSVVDGKVITKTENGYRAMSMGQVKQAKVRMRLEVERSSSKELHTQAKSDVQDERDERRRYKQEQKDKTTGLVQARRERGKVMGDLLDE